MASLSVPILLLVAKYVSAADMTSLPFDCNADYTSCYHCLQKHWSATKRAWCCAHGGRGCSTTAPPATTSLPYDCDADYISCYHCLEKKWSVGKRAWCCAHGGRGCSTTPPPATPAPTTPATTSLPYDCNADYISCYHCLEKKWSVGKRAWCCAHGGRGCSTTPPPATPPPTTAPATTSLPYDCNADYISCYHCLEKKWSVGKRAWCCAHGGRGCSTTPAPTTLPPTTSLPYDCNADYISCYHCLEKKWSVGKRAWCCAHGGRGCSTTPAPATTSLPFDCNAGFDNWEAGWSDPKKIWCCQHVSKGCTTTPPPPPPPPPPTTSVCPPLDCNVGYNNWQAGWGEEKKTYCCQHFNKACPGAPPPTSPCPPLDCNVGFNNWQAGWGEQKKAYCCQHFGKACPVAPPPPAPPAPPVPFTTVCPPQDCNAAFGNWMAAWPPQKKAWCCTHEGKGCLPGMVPFSAKFEEQPEAGLAAPSGYALSAVALPLAGATFGIAALAAAGRMRQGRSAAARPEEQPFTRISETQSLE